jgi:hypothetical protein
VHFLQRREGGIVHPQPSAQQPREEAKKKEEALREEEERRRLDVRLRDFDAYSFYENMEVWADYPVPPPFPQMIRLTPLRRKVIMHQPIPLTRNELREIRRLSEECVKLLSLLRAVDQLGMECPYIHRLHRSGLEKAIDKCVRIKIAQKNYIGDRGVFAWLWHILNGLHLSAMRREVHLFQERLEAILVMCRHEEFAHDLMNLRREFSYRAPQYGVGSLQGKR